MATTLTPAYGRDYKTAKAVKADWQDGKDFIIADYFSEWDGKPMNREQAKPGEVFNIRYHGLRKIVVVRA